jgi:hypothetical protein
LAVKKSNFTIGKIIFYNFFFLIFVVPFGNGVIITLTAKHDTGKAYIGLEQLSEVHSEQYRPAAVQCVVQADQGSDTR